MGRRVWDQVVTLNVGFMELLLLIWRLTGWRENMMSASWKNGHADWVGCPFFVGVD